MATYVESNDETQAPHQPFLIECEECGLVVEIPTLKEDHKASCPRCHHTLIKSVIQPYQRPLAYGIACLIMLVLSVSFPFMSFSFKGLTQTITLLHAAEMMQFFKYGELALLLILTVLILPLCYVGSQLYFYWLAGHFKRLREKGVDPLAKRKHWKWIARWYRWVFHLEHWLMVDVFLIGILVSLVKIAALAKIGMGISFWAFCAYTILVVKCIAITDRTWLWAQLSPPIPLDNVKAGDTYLSGNHVACHCCGQLNIPTKDHASCVRCYGTLHPFNRALSLQKTWALLICAIVFYFPANLFPMMYTISLGNDHASTIMGGVVTLWKMGSYPVATIIFLASIAIPLAKMLAIIWMLFRVHTVKESSIKLSKARLSLYRMTELIGRWSMVDIFVVALLVALVQLQNLMAIEPGPAALSFAIVVVSTMLSAMYFDPRMFFLEKNEHHPEVKNSSYVSSVEPMKNSEKKAL